MASFRNWLNRLSSMRPIRRASRKTAALRPGFRPSLETLEDRLAPAITVTSIADSGAGTLRDAINQANLTVAADTIDFQITGATPGVVQTINLQSLLPNIIHPVVIDGTTENGWSSSPLIELNGVANGGVFWGLNLAPGSDGSTIKALAINRCFLFGIGVNSNNNLVQLSYIGTNAAGTATALPGGPNNAVAGIYILPGVTGNTIGGNRGNVLSGNLGSGVFIAGPGNTVSGNLIGLDKTGGAAVGNGVDGVRIQAGANNTISSNSISGNANAGVFLLGPLSTGNTIKGNQIGLNRNGNAAIPNALDGVWIEDAPNNTIGGIAPGDRNFISGNGRAGVLLNNPGASGNTLLGNYIGLDTAGSSIPVPNVFGVWLLHGASNNTIGGTTAAETNVISGNSAMGVVLQSSNTMLNQIKGNYIGTDPTGVSAIANGYDGVLAFGGAKNNVIGGAAAGAGNLISGNGRGGIVVMDAGTTANVAQGNTIGLNKLMTAAVPNVVGMWVGGAASGTVIGTAANGLNVSAGNTIAGNTVFGLAITGAGTMGNSAAGNFIGTNASGAAGLGNGFDGAYLSAGAGSNTIGGAAGGTPASLRNVIGGNGRDGVRIEGVNTNGNVVQANYIGLKPDGATALKNNENGVDVRAYASFNLIGGASADSRNFISSNGETGVMITDVGTNNNTVAANVIGADIGLTLARGNVIGVQIAAGAKNNVLFGFAAAGSFIVSSKTAGVRITDAGTTNNVVRGYSIGLLPTPAAAQGNTIGIDVANGASGNAIGGTAAGASNVIANNTSSIPGSPGVGVSIHDPMTLKNVVIGNFIGTNAASLAGFGNGIGVKVSGVGSVSSLSDANVIGGLGTFATPAPARNVISGNTGPGIQVLGNGITPLAPGNSLASLVIQGNYVGTDVAGTAALPNHDGILIVGETRNVLIGGSTLGAGNLISGNTQDGVHIDDNLLPFSSTSGNVIQGNRIGTTAAGGFNPLGNGAQGISITGAMSSGNTVGGMLEVLPSAGNVIAFNVGRGVLIDAGNGNAILGNLIYANSHPGIDLNNDGITANDLNDADIGSDNNLQNFPVLTYATTQGGNTLVYGTLNSDPNIAGTVYRLEFFAGSTILGNAEVYLGYVTVTTTGNNSSFAVVLPVGTASFNNKLVVTATNMTTMDTSEFSAIALIV